MNLKNVSQGVYTPPTSVESGEMFPIWLGDSKTFCIMGGIINLNAKFLSTGSIKVSDVYPSAIRAGALIQLSKSDHSALPIPVYRVVEAVSASATKVTLLQGYGLPLAPSGCKLQTFESTPKQTSALDFTASSGNAVINADGNLEITIIANALGTLAVGEYLILEDAASLVPAGLSESTKMYEGVTLASTQVDVNIVDGGRILEKLSAGVPFSLWTKYLQTIKLA